MGRNRKEEKQSHPGCALTKLAHACLQLVLAVPPLATPKTFPQAKTGPTTVPAPGALTGDSVPCGSAATIRVVSGPSAGSVVLSQNGSFVYTPVASPGANDSFVYEINCNGLVSQATISLGPQPGGVQASYHALAAKLGALIAARLPATIQHEDYTAACCQFALIVLVANPISSMQHCYLLSILPALFRSQLCGCRRRLQLPCQHRQCGTDTGSVAQ